MKPTIVAFCLLLTSALAGQDFSASINITDASCQGNGAIMVQTNGGSGDFRYLLSNDCGGAFPPQNTPDFTTLPPCFYTIIVEDRITGVSRNFNFTIDGNTEPLEASVVFAGCDGSIVINGGNGPFTVTFITDDSTAVFTTDSTTIALPPLNDSDVNGSVVDDCGNSRNFSGAATATAIRNFVQEQTDTALIVAPTGGEPPYTFTLQSSFGAFSNGTGVFPWTQVGCTPTLSISSACSGGELTDEEIELDLEVRWNCVRFADGFADVAVSPPNRGPYTYEITAAGVSFTQTDSVFTGLPVNAESYNLSITDVCGQEGNFEINITRYQMDLLGVADGCSDTEIAIQIDRQCAGPLFVPITITCESCPGDAVPSFFQNGRGDTTFILGNPIGSWQLTMEDECGDRLRCEDELRLEALSACDSIVTNFVQILTCDNGTFSRRPVNEASAVYTLEDASGTVLETGNTTGRFTGVGPGDYRVRTTADCGSLSANVTIQEPAAIDPFFDFYPDFSFDENGDCRMTYRMRLEQADGPFVLTGGPDNEVYEQFNDFGQDNCSFYDNEVILTPGTYTLASFGTCGSVAFTLPEIVEPRFDSVAIRSTCPGNTSVEVFSLFRNNGEYRAWFLEQGIRIATQSNIGDYYIVNGNVYRDANFINGLPPGVYEMHIVPRFSRNRCAIDTYPLVIPEYEQVGLQVQGDVLCDTSGTVPLRLFPEKGNGPYVVREVDCTDPTAVLAAYDVAVGEAADVPVVSVGTYCFVVEDVCGITADFQVEVRSLTGALRVNYDCSPALILSTDTLPGTFQWFAADGSPLGTDAVQRIVPPTADTEFTLEVDIGTCVLRETVAVVARPIIPVLNVLQPASGEVVQCDSDTVVLVAATDTFSVINWDEPFTGDTLITQTAGLRQLTATNDLGCVTAGEIEVRRVIAPVPIIAPAPDYCFGDTLSLGIDGRGTDGRPLAGIDWSLGQSLTDSIAVSGTGFYGVSVTDVDGCTAVDTFTFVEPGPVNYRLEVDSVSCFNARDAVVRVLDLSGGTPAFTFFLNDDDYLPGEPIDNVDIGAYRFRARDSHGCMLDSTFTIGQPDSLAVDLGGDQFVKLGEVLVLPLSTNADTLVSVEWRTTNPLEVLGEDRVRLTALATDSVRVFLTDQLGCIATNSFRLTVDRGVLVYVANAFSPNGDGVNDLFVVQGDRTQITSINSLLVYDRWGNRHFGETDMEANDFSRGWDGTINGRTAPVGTYVWAAEVTLVNGETRALRGEVHLIR